MKRKKKNFPNHRSRFAHGECTVEWYPSIRKLPTFRELSYNREFVAIIRVRARAHCFPGRASEAEISLPPHSLCMCALCRKQTLGNRTLQMTGCRGCARGREAGVWRSIFKFSRARAPGYERVGIGISTQRMARIGYARALRLSLISIWARVRSRAQSWIAGRERTQANYADGFWRESKVGF